MEVPGRAQQLVVAGSSDLSDTAGSDVAFELVLELVVGHQWPCCPYPA
jgi:hypothetical protein